MKKFLLIFGLLFLTSVLYSQWEPVNKNLFGSDIISLASNDSCLFAGTTGHGIFVSTDKGYSWSQSGLEFTSVTSIQIIGKNIFAATIDAGIFLSTDNGMSWVAKNNGLTNLKVLSIAYLWKKILIGTKGDGVFISSDNGNSWEQTGLENTEVMSIAVIDNYIYAGTNGNGVFVSNDNGNTWSQKNTVLSNSVIFSLENFGADILAGTRGGIFLSTDKGNSWTLKGLQTSDVMSIAVKDSIIYAGTGAGIFVGKVDIIYWFEKNIGLTNLGVQSLLLNDWGLFAGTDGGGIFHSTDDGELWSKINENLTAAVVESLTSKDSLIFAGSGDGIFSIGKNGNYWTKKSLNIQYPYILSFVLKDNLIFAGTQGNGVIVSSDNGNTWTEKNNGLSNLFVFSMAVKGDLIFAGTVGKVYVSSDNGNTWTEKDNGLTNYQIQCLVINGNNIFAGTKNGIFLSTDNGNSWARLGYKISNVISLAINGNNIFAGTENGIYLSTDFGNSWVQKSNGIPNVTVWDLFINNSNIFAFTNGGVFISTDNGQYWLEKNDGLINYDIRSFVVSDTVLYVGTYGAGVFRANISDLFIDTRPNISQIPDQILEENQTKEVDLIVNGKEPNNLQFFISSSNSVLLPSDSIQISGSDIYRTLIISPKKNSSGESIVVIMVTDGKDSASTEFKVIVNKAIKPTISEISDQIMKENETKQVYFNVNGKEPDNLQIIITSTNSDLLPKDSIQVSGNGLFRTLILSPKKKSSGESYIKIQVTDGNDTASTEFKVVVLKSSNVIERQEILSKIYPNPVNNLLTIERTNPAPAILTITNQLGQITYVNEFQEGEQTKQIPMEKQSSGIYFIKILYNDGVTEIYKFVKK